MAATERTGSVDRTGGWILAGAVALVWLVLMPRLVPSIAGDHGTFVSVADRLRAGDRLYVDVWDNKDPIFFYGLSLARALLPLGDFVLEVLWLALAATATTLIGTATGLGRRTALLVGWIGAPIVLLGFPYVAGMTHLPGTAITLWAIAAAVRSKWVAAGLLLAALVGTKLMMVPVAAVAVLAVLAIQRDVRGLWRTAAGGVVGLALLAALLQLRGELGPFLDMQAYNMAYANGPIIDSQHGSFVGHLLRVVSIDGRGGVLTTVAATVFIAIAAGSRSNVPKALLAGIWTTLVAELVVLGLTGFWPHHGQILGVSSILALTAGAAALAPLASSVTPRAVLLTGAAAFVLGGAVHPYWYLEDVKALRTSIAAMGSPSPEATALLEIGDHGSYARLGKNDTTAHARGLGSWTLGCWKFQLYPFDDPGQLDRSLTCVDRVDAVLVDASFVPATDPTTPGKAAWDDFVVRANAELGASFACTPEPWGRLCLRNDSLDVGTG